MDDSLALLDLQHYTNLSMQDYELFPGPDSIADPVIYRRTAEIHRQLTSGEHTTKAPWCPSSMPLSSPALQLGQSGSGHDMDVAVYPMMSDISSPYGRDLSSPGAETPPSQNTNWWNIGCYMSPPSSCADSMLPPPDLWGPPSPNLSASVVSSVAPSQIEHSYPIPIPIAESEFDLEPRQLIEPTPTYENQVYPHNGASDANEAQRYLRPHHGSVQEPVTLPTRPRLPASPPSGRIRGARPKNGVKKNLRKKEPLNDIPTRMNPITSKVKNRRGARPRRTFLCSFSRYGCTSSFGSKNEWKRHVTSQHLQLGFYRCDVGQCNVNHLSRAMNPPNDFNRKDLFTQHQRRMHAPWSKSGEATEEEKRMFDASLETVRNRCWREQRPAPPRSHCGFCGEEFAGPQSWNRRMEHVGRHYEKADVPLEVEVEDIALRDWAIQEGVLRLTGGKWKLTSHCEN
ncbi:hypothetical protein BBP40_012022 [Aspergillus hancockii]|nr:hypothetical protein BBP40_012022 [Aspergillus hancockii]